MEDRFGSRSWPIGLCRPDREMSIKPTAWKKTKLSGAGSVVIKKSKNISNSSSKDNGGAET